MSYVLESNTKSSKILYIDSRDADSYLATKFVGNTSIDLTSYFQYVLKENIEVPLNQRALISLNGATIPYSFYNIRQGVNDELTATASNQSETPIPEFTRTLIIDAGNYSVYDLQTEIKNFFNNTLQDSGNGIEYTFDMTYNITNGKYTYKITPKGSAVADTINIVLKFQDKELLSPHIEMGFGPNDITLSSSAETLSENVVDINGSIHGVYIRTNLVSTGTLDSQSKTFSNILARIPINVQSGGVIFADPSNQTHRSVVDIRSINTLTIRLTDERNRILDLNGLHFQLGISIDFIHGKKPNQREQGSLGESGGGSYLVDNDAGRQSQLKIQNAIVQRQLQEKEERASRRRGVGRPRRVGRPKGSTKINDDN